MDEEANLTEEKLNKRQQQAIATKERIYKCADQLFREKGYDETSVVEIATAAGISVGGFYHHFKNKEEIMRLWIGEFDTRYWEFYTNELCGPKMKELPVFTRLRLMMASINTIFSSHGFMLSRMAYSLMLRDQMVGGFIINDGRDYYAIIRELVQEAQEQGLIQPQYGTEEIVKEITVLNRGCMVEWLLQNGQDDLLRMIDRLLAIYLESISIPQQK